jgi:tetraacyldisaccharide 4'-kinase
MKPNPALHALSKLYTLLSTLERHFFRTLSFLVLKPDALVISVGNLSMGGTGKTPVLLELLAELPPQTAVLTRGYRCPWERSFYHLQGPGPHPHQITDEALMANARFPNTPIFIGKNRRHAAIMALQRCKPRIFLLDDGFQYRRLRKDFNILLIDAMSTPAEAQVVPLGNLREPLHRLNDAQCIALTRCNTAPQAQVDQWLAKINAIAPSVPILQLGTYCDGLFNFLGNKLTPASTPYLAFCAIGRPQSFYAQLEQLGITIAIKREFRDHHQFTQNELEELHKKASSEGLTLICTEKDAIKIPKDMAKKMQLQILRIRIRPLDQKPFLHHLPTLHF